MKLIGVLSGPGEIAKRLKLTEIKSKFDPDSITVVDLRVQGPEELTGLIQSTSLFESSQRLIVVENTPESLDLTTLPTNNSGLTLVCLAANPKSDRPLIKSATKLGAKRLEFAEEKELTAFPFVDGLLERSPQAFTELSKLLATYGGIYTLSMIYYGLRRNLLPPPASSFIKEKVARQKKGWEPTDWQTLYLQTLQTEFKIKSGLISEELGLSSLVSEFVSHSPGKR